MTFIEESPFVLMTSTHEGPGEYQKVKSEGTSIYNDHRYKNGGYCFYPVDEPNISDTWYALGSLVTADLYAIPYHRSN